MTTILEDVVSAPAPMPATVNLPNPELTGKDVLLIAADAIDKRGWCRGMFENEHGNLCAIGALRFAAGYEPDDPDFRSESAAYMQAKTALRLSLGVYDVMHWNDHDVPKHRFVRKSGARYVSSAMRQAAERCA